MLIMPKFPSNEYELINRLQKILPPVNAIQTAYEKTIGDDAAVRVSKNAGERLIFTADISVENIHFSLDTMTLEEIGYKAMVSNLSDCAAMGAVPDSALVQLVFPQNGKDITDSVEKIYTGFARACGRWNFPIVGGDLSGGSVWTIGITLIGAIPPEGRAFRRTGVAGGDALWVTGMPGVSAAGLAALRRWGRGKRPPCYKKIIDAHITPAPRINEGIALAACPSIHAMMDLSDGLSKDVGTLCFDNNLGFIFERRLEQRLLSIQSSTITSSIQEMINLADGLKCDWRDWFYHGGEEYELLFACAPSFDPRSVINDIDGNDTAQNMIKLGHFTAEFSEMRIPRENGETEELQPSGWDHCRN